MLSSSFSLLRTVSRTARAAGALLLVCALAACGGSDGAERIGGLRLIGDYSIKTKTMFEGVEFGGISGIDRAPDGTYWAISDERGGERGTPRFYALSIDFDATRIKSVGISKMVYLRGPDGKPLSSTTRTLRSGRFSESTRSASKLPMCAPSSNTPRPSPIAASSDSRPCTWMSKRRKDSARRKTRSRMVLAK